MTTGIFLSSGNGSLSENLATCQYSHCSVVRATERDLVLSRPFIITGPDLAGVSDDLAGLWPS